MDTPYDNTKNNLTQPQEICTFLECEALPTIEAMRALFKAIKAMTSKFDTLHELAKHGQYLGDVLHNDMDVARERMSDALKESTAALA